MQLKWECAVNIGKSKSVFIVWHIQLTFKYAYFVFIYVILYILTTFSVCNKALVNASNMSIQVDNVVMDYGAPSILLKLCAVFFSGFHSQAMVDWKIYSCNNS